MTAPRRRWSFSPRTLFVLVTAISCLGAYFLWVEHIVKIRRDLFSAGHSLHGVMFVKFPYVAMPSLSYYRSWRGDTPRQAIVISERSRKESIRLFRHAFPEARIISIDDYEAERVRLDAGLQQKEQAPANPAL